MLLTTTVHPSDNGMPWECYKRLPALLMSGMHKLSRSTSCAKSLAPAQMVSLQQLIRQRARVTATLAAAGTLPSQQPSKPKAGAGPGASSAGRGTPTTARGKGRQGRGDFSTLLITMIDVLSFQARAQSAYLLNPLYLVVA